MTGLLFFFSALGAFNGLILSTYLFFFSKKKTLSKYLLGALILALSIRIGKSVFLYFDRDLPKIYLQVGLSACFFIGPFLYFYLKSVVKKINIFPKSWQWTLVTLFVVIVGIGIARPYEQYPDTWNNLVHFIYWQWLVFILAAGFLLKTIFLKLIQPTSYINAAERWLLAIYLGNFVIFSAFFLTLYGASSAYYITGPLVFSFFLYLAVFGYFYTNNTQFSEQKPIKKYADKKIASSEANRLSTQLENLMTQTEIYKNPKLKLKTVADELAIPSHHLSQFLNDNLGKSFNAYINEYRIKAACQLLQQTHNLSLEGIGYEVGFNSKSTFFNAFKKIMGATPARYQRQISLENS